MQTPAQLAQLLVAAYSGTPDIQAGGDARAFFRYFPDELVVVIPGTATVAGWIRDFEFWPARSVRIGRCHSGFLLNGERLWAGIKPVVAEAVKRGLAVTYSGHSLGGAEAQACAALHVSYGLPITRVVTFGSPRLALWINRTIRALMRDVPMTLYKRAADRVPHVPFSRLLFCLPWYGHLRINTIIGAALPGSDVRWPLDPVNDPNHGIVQYAKDLEATK